MPVRCASAHSPERTMQEMEMLLLTVHRFLALCELMSFTAELNSKTTTAQTIRNDISEWE